jgi:hypothetical protein
METLILIIGALVTVTNIIVEVVKKLTWDKLPTNILATIVAMVLTMVAFFAYTSYAGLTIVWYWVVAAFIVGIFVAYAAMFGFDKLQEAFKAFKKLKE